MTQYGAYMEDSDDEGSGCVVCDLLTDGATLTAKLTVAAPRLWWLRRHSHQRIHCHHHEGDCARF